MTPLYCSVALIATVLFTEVIQSIAQPKQYRYVSLLRPLPQLELQTKSPWVRRQPSPSSIPKSPPSSLRLQTSKSPSSVTKLQSSVSKSSVLRSPVSKSQVSKTPVSKLQVSKTLSSKPSVSKSPVPKLPVLKSPSSTVSLLPPDSFSLFKLPLQIISSILLPPTIKHNASSIISPLVNFQMPLTFSTVHSHNPLPFITNNSPSISCNNLSGKTNILPYPYNSLSNNCTNNLPNSCNPSLGYTNNSPNPCIPPTGNTNNSPNSCNPPTGNTNNSPNSCNPPTGNKNNSPNSCNPSSDNTNNSPTPCNSPTGNTNNSPNSCNPSSDNTNNSPTPCNSSPSNTNNSSSPCNTPSVTTNNLPKSFNSQPSNINNVPYSRISLPENTNPSPDNINISFIPNNSIHEKPYDILSWLCNLLLYKIRSQSSDYISSTPSESNSPVIVTPPYVTIYSTTPSDDNNTDGTSTENPPNDDTPICSTNEPKEQCQITSTHKICKFCLPKRIPWKSHNLSIYNVPVIGSYSHVPLKVHPLNHATHSLPETYDSALNPLQEELVLKMLKSLISASNLTSPINR